MITTALLVLMAVSILVLVLLVIYLVDRFNGLERETQGVIRGLQDQASQAASASASAAKSAGPYAGLSGQALWDAVSGSPPEGLDDLALDGVRKRYRLLLGEHIGHIFNEGATDQRRGMDSPPKNVRTIRTPKTQVESWLPPEAVAEIYQCGQGHARNDAGELPSVRQRLDAVCSQLHEMAGLEVLQPTSNVLMPPADAANSPTV